MRSGWGELLHDVVFGKSVLLLLGGLIIGAIAQHVLAVCAPHFEVAMHFSTVSALRPDRF